MNILEKQVNFVIYLNSVDIIYRAMIDVYCFAYLIFCFGTGLYKLDHMASSNGASNGSTEATCTNGRPQSSMLNHALHALADFSSCFD